MRFIMVKADKLISEAESLPIEMRAKLADKLLKSLNPSQKEIDALWAKEAEQRVEEIKTKKVKTIPGKKVFKEIQKRLNS